MTRSARGAALLLGLAATLPLAGAGAQVPDSTRRDSTRRDSVVATPQDAPAGPVANAGPPAAAARSGPTFDFSGVLYAGFQYGGAKGNRSQDRFDVNRVYLTFRGDAGARVAYRVTLDIFQNTDDARNQYYGGFVDRVKYAYGQYTLVDGPAAALKANVRLGILHTPIVDYEEQFWPRGVQQVALEQAGFFSSADVGAATLVTLPHRLGEFYAAVLNGNGYAQRETDRFKDFGGRLSVTPFASSHGFAHTFAITPWYYNGTRASDFARQRGTVLPVSEGRTRDRWGVHIGVRDPALTIAAQIAFRTDELEAADTTVALVPTVVSRDGRVVSAYTIVRPFDLLHSRTHWPLSALFRVDEITPDVHAAPAQRQFITGIGWDLTKKATLWADAQVQQPHGVNVPDLRTYVINAVINF